MTPQEFIDGFDDIELLPIDTILPKFAVMKGFTQKSINTTSLNMSADLNELFKLVRDDHPTQFSILELPIPKIIHSVAYENGKVFLREIMDQDHIRYDVLYK